MADSDSPTLLSGEKTVTTAGTAVALASSRRVAAVTIVAKDDNTGKVYVGGSDIASGTNNGLAPGDIVQVAADAPGYLDLADIFIDSDNNSEGVDFYAAKAHGVIPYTSGRGRIEGLAASDAAERGNPVQIGGSVDDTSPIAAGEGDGRRIRATSNGFLLTAIARADVDNTPAFVGPNGDALSATRNSLSVMGASQGLAPDGSLDRLRSLGNTGGAGLGVLAAAPWIPGASDVKTIIATIGATSASRNTALTPTAGKKVRIIGIDVAGKLTTAPDRVGIYFHTGAAYTTDTANGIAQGYLGATGEFSRSWPDGGGPVGAADEVVSWITETETETGIELTITYREE